MSGLAGIDRAAGLATLDADRLWRAVRDAAAGSRAGAAATVAGLCRGGGTVRLGWAVPAAWPAVAEQVTAIAAALGRPAAHRIVVLGTGGWCFAAQAIAELSNGDQTISTLDSPDPVPVRQAMPAGPRPASYLAISGSGTTLETRRLAELATRLTGGRVVWLCDRAAPPARLALSAPGSPDHVAMLGAPLSAAFLAVAHLADPVGLARAYSWLAGQYQRLAVQAARRAGTVPLDGPIGLRFVVPGWAGPGLRRWLLQLGRQVLCGKSARFRPVVDVGAEPAPTGSNLDLRGVRRGLPGLLALLYEAGVFTACLGLRAGLEIAEHRHVRAYKDLLAGDPAPPPSPVVAMRELAGYAATWLAGRPDLRRLHIVHYWSGTGHAGADGAAARFTAATGRPCEVHEGSAWNHHSFQAVYPDPHAAVLLTTRDDREASCPALAAAAGTLARIAWATHRALPDRSRLVRLAAGGG
jgi:hypothetical protein